MLPVRILRNINFVYFLVVAFATLRTFKCNIFNFQVIASVGAMTNVTKFDIPIRHREYMKRALHLASRAIGKTSPNPCVGCVILDSEGSVVGEGWHEQAGRDHAEVMALRQAGIKAKGGTAYVSLEPCNHYGKTPPCALALIRSGVKRVFAGMVDPDLRVSGNGLEFLRMNGVEVACGVEQEACQRLNAPFIYRVLRNRCYCLAWVGMTNDNEVVHIDSTLLTNHIYDIAPETDTILVTLDQFLSLMGISEEKIDRLVEAIDAIDGSNERDVDENIDSINDFSNMNSKFSSSLFHKIPSHINIVISSVSSLTNPVSSSSKKFMAALLNQAIKKERVRCNNVACSNELDTKQTGEKNKNLTTSIHDNISYGNNNTSFSRASVAPLTSMQHTSTQNACSNNPLLPMRGCMLVLREGIIIDLSVTATTTADSIDTVIRTGSLHAVNVKCNKKSSDSSSDSKISDNQSYPTKLSILSDALKSFCESEDSAKYITNNTRDCSWSYADVAITCLHTGCNALLILPGNNADICDLIKHDMLQSLIISKRVSSSLGREVAHTLKSNSNLAMSSEISDTQQVIVELKRNADQDKDRETYEEAYDDLDRCLTMLLSTIESMLPLQTEFSNVSSSLNHHEKHMSHHCHNFSSLSSSSSRHAWVTSALRFSQRN